MNPQLLVDEIPEEGLLIDLWSTQHAWLHGAMQQALHDHFLPNDDVHLTLNVVRLGRNVDMIGGLFMRVHATCDRCLREFSVSQQIPIHMVMAPAGSVEETASDPTDDDLNFSLYHGRHIDLEGLICEQVVLAQPMQTLCTPDCKGLCPRCGVDLNQGACQCGG
ncbi:MAG: DUF177 domain-containing protein [Deltaproteobacteria bacterium]|nr:DUF177 domain-containing protein [Deltaproteobacteria bacterium]